MRYVRWTEMRNHPLYSLLEHALTFPYDYNKKCSPQTRDGYFVSVAAIYNLSRWGNWKSSSLGKDEREVSVLIDHLHLLELMNMNKGRKSQEPANFPDGELFPIVLDEDKLKVY